MLERDCERLWDCHSRVNVCPLGSGAIAGSTLPLDRELVAKLLGFVDASGKPQLTQNSMDAVSDRDFRRRILRRRRAAGRASFAAGGGRDSLGRRGI
jgi:argininosuccinate lyase